MLHQRVRNNFNLTSDIDRSYQSEVMKKDEMETHLASKLIAIWSISILNPVSSMNVKIFGNKNLPPVKSFLLAHSWLKNETDRAGKILVWTLWTSELSDFCFISAPLPRILLWFLKRTSRQNYKASDWTIAERNQASSFRGFRIGKMTEVDLKKKTLNSFSSNFFRKF